MNKDLLIFGAIGGGSAILAFGASYALLETSSLLADFAAHIRLVREENAPLGTIFVIPPQSIVEKRKLDKSGIKKEASVVINEFVSTLEKEGINLDNLYRRFQPHSVQSNLKLAGQYQPSTGILYVDTENLRETLLRALLEETITFDDEKKFVACGFERVNFDSKGKEKVIEWFGFGLNEAYKQIFMERYFGLPNQNTSLVTLAFMIENLVGREKMEKAFLTGDFIEFLYSRRNVFSVNKFKKWVKKLDTIYDSLYMGLSYCFKNTSLLKQLGAASFRSLFVEIAKDYIDQIKENVLLQRCNELDADIALSRLDRYLAFTGSGEKSGDYKLRRSDVEAVQAYLNQAFPNHLVKPYTIRPKNTTV